MKRHRWTASSLIGATDLFREAHGFQVLASDPGPDAFPLLMVGDVAKGAVILTSTHPDKTCVFPLDPADKEKSRRFFENVMAFAQNRADVQSEAQETAPIPAVRRVTVFEDLNANGTLDEGEKGRAGVDVLYGFQAFATDNSGVAEVPITPADLLPLSVSIPDGFRPTGPVFLDALGSDSFQVGMAPEQAPRGDLVIYQLSDIHIGDEKPQQDERYLEQFLAQLQRQASPTDLFVVTGDNTQRAYEDEFQGFLQGFKALTNQVLFVMGNHDGGEGPDWGRVYQDDLGPMYYSADIGGYRFITMPVLRTTGPEGAWLAERIQSTALPVWILTHKFPTRKAFDWLPAKRVAGVLSGHWHGDMVSQRAGVLNINMATSVFGAWDFSPAAARKVVVHEGQARTELVPFVRFPMAGALRSDDGVWHVGATLPVDFAPPLCTVGKSQLPLTRTGPFSWQAPGPREGKVACVSGQAPVPMSCQLPDSVTAPSCPAETASGLRLRWASTLPGQVLLASPVSVGSHLLVPLRNTNQSDSYGGLCSLRISTGALEWCHLTPSQVTSTPVVASGLVIVTEVTGYRWGLDPTTGNVVWQASLDEALDPTYVNHYVYSPGLVADKRVYYCYQSGPFAISPQTGEVVWQGQAFAGQDHFGLSKGYWAADRLLCASYMGGLYSYNTTMKNARREVLNEDITTCSDLKSWAKFLWVLTRNELLKLNRANGKQVGRFSLSEFILPIEPQFEGDHRVLVPYGSSSLAMLDTKTGKRTWTFALKSGPMTFETNRHESPGLVGSPILTGNRVVIAGTDGTLTVLENGKPIASASVGVPLASTPLIRSGLILVADYGGTVYAFSLER